MDPDQQRLQALRRRKSALSARSQEPAGEADDGRSLRGSVLSASHLSRASPPRSRLGAPPGTGLNPRASGESSKGAVQSSVPRSLQERLTTDAACAALCSVPATSAELRPHVPGVAHLPAQGYILEPQVRHAGFGTHDSAQTLWQLVTACNKEWRWAQPVRPSIAQCQPSQQGRAHPLQAERTTEPRPEALSLG